ncbi:MAG: DNA topoisomerase (ATP-hydrolyzing) subunit B [bacterium]
MAREKKQNNESTYTAKNIQVLEGLDPVRKRPGMYIGSTGVDGLHHLIWEVVDNSIDEAMGGYARDIEVRLLKDGWVSVLDDGRGIPVDVHSVTKKSALETVLTTLHAGGKFEKGAYKVSGGLHGVGVSVVNALSIGLRAEIYQNGNVYMQEYIQGKPVKAVRKIDKTDKTGTKISFKADNTIFPVTEYDLKRVLHHLRQQAYLTRGVRIVVIDEREEVPQYYAYRFDSGIKSFIKYLNEDGDKVVHPSIFFAEREYEGIQIELALAYNDGIETHELSFANNIHTIDGGMHLTGFRSALTRVLNDYARTNNLIKEKDENLTGDDVREGLVAIVSIKIAEPQFEGQTKARLGNTEARSAVEAVAGETLREFLEKNPNDARPIIEKAFLAARARKAAKAAKDTILRKGILEGLTLPGKLADCQTRKAEEGELFIVEGDSAGGSAKQGRDRRTQAILPLRGKILNVEKARMDKMLANKEIRSFIIAIGTAIADEFNINKLRYHKIIIMTDADVDGAHIRTLLLNLVYRHFPMLIEQGYLYIAQPPLYRLQSGKRIEYAYSDNDKETLLKTFDGKQTVSIQRYKGLGEMNPLQLWETTMDPETRMLKRVTIEDARETDRLFDILMGSEVAPRKHFIMTHCHLVGNLDL